MIVTSCDNIHNKELESANNNFDLFRKFHRFDDPGYTHAFATLKGDYYFSRFSLDLIPVDSVEITDRFARVLREDASGAVSPEISYISYDDPGSLADGKRALEDQLRRICYTDNTSMKEDLERVLLSGGKRLRPALAQTAYNLGSGGRYPILPLMVMIELMHSASLIHDDVVDNGRLRRGVPTINATSGDLNAVRSADFILGRAMELLKIYRGSGIDERLASVSEQMCIGELRQMELLNSEIDEDTYLSLIEKKTAFFIEAAAACGAIAGGCDDHVIKGLEEYGYNIGMAFQIKDDILDHTGKKIFGKETGQDKKKGLRTLPDISGIEKAQERVEDYSNKAIAALKDLGTKTPVKTLIKMAKQLEKREI